MTINNKTKYQIKKSGIMVGFHDATFLYIRLYYIHLINIYIIIYYPCSINSPGFMPNCFWKHLEK